MKKFYETNRKRWNELVDIHEKTSRYNVEGFKEGHCSLKKPELDALPNVRGKTLLHLQCHFGLDTLSWARRGAEVTGVDFSESAIHLARSIAEELQIPSTFVSSNIYDLLERLLGSYDVVFTSYGVLNWLHDLKRWAEIIEHYLKPGGTFFISEFHPFAWVLDDGHPSELKVKYSYWHTEKPQLYRPVGSYADRNAVVENKDSYEWAHPISDIINSLNHAGLKIEEIKEYPYCVDPLFHFMQKDSEGNFRFINKDYQIPLMFSVKAKKPIKHIS